MRPVESSKGWIVPISAEFSRSPQAKLRLFCFPYAGGSASLFRNWSSLKGVEVCAVQLPGHGNRLAEPPFQNLRDLVPAAARGLREWLDKPYALFGHSMGALIAFELARYQQSRGLPPRHLIASGCRAPHLAISQKRTYDLPDCEFMEELRLLKGTPMEVLAESALMKIVLPAIRADFAISQGYQYEAGEKLVCPIAVFGGDEDTEISDGLLDRWRQQTSRECTVTYFSGNHFYLHKEEHSVVRAMSVVLRPYV